MKSTQTGFFSDTYSAGLPNPFAVMVHTDGKNFSTVGYWLLLAVQGPQRTDTVPCAQKQLIK